MKLNCDVYLYWAAHCPRESNGMRPGLLRNANSFCSWSVRFGVINPVLECHVQRWDVNILFRCCATLRTCSVFCYLDGRSVPCCVGRLPVCNHLLHFHFAETYIHQAAHCSSHLHLDFVCVQTARLTTHLLLTAHFKNGFKWTVCCSISILPKQQFGVFTAMMIHTVIFWGMIMWE